MKTSNSSIENFLGSLALMASAVCLLAIWIFQCAERAAQRRILADLDDRLLRDVGLSRGHVAAEVSKPAWRA